MTVATISSQIGLVDLVDIRGKSSDRDSWGCCHPHNYVCQIVDSGVDGLVQNTLIILHRGAQRAQGKDEKRN